MSDVTEVNQYVTHGEGKNTKGAYNGRGCLTTKGGTNTYPGKRLTQRTPNPREREREGVEKNTRGVDSQEENGLEECRGDLLTGMRGDLGGVEIARGALG